MRKRKKAAPRSRPGAWIMSPSFQVKNKTVERGAQITVRDHDGRKRRVKFLEHVTNTAIPEPNSWITCSEPMEKGSKSTTTRSWAPERVLTVHRKQKETR